MRTICALLIICIAAASAVGAQQQPFFAGIVPDDTIAVL
jgi:hypothetical protein